MKGHGEKLSRKRDQAIVALIDHPTIPDAAAHCGVSESTLRRWMADPGFAADLDAARKRLFDDAIGILKAGTVKAAATLIKHCDAANDADAIRAARAVIELYTRTVQLNEIAERLEALEAAMTERDRMMKRRAA